MERQTGWNYCGHDVADWQGGEYILNLGGVCNPETSGDNGTYHAMQRIPVPATLLGKSLRVDFSMDLHGFWHTRRKKNSGVGAGNRHFPIRSRELSHFLFFLTKGPTICSNLI